MQFFALDDDERVITETAAAFAAKRVAPHALEWDATKHFPTDVLREAAELGMAAIYCRDDVGGSGLRRLDGVRIFEQLAIADPTTAAFLSIHNMCAWMIDTFGTAEQRKSWVPRLASMDVIASYCLTEPGAGSDAGALSTRAVKHGGDYVLDGVKQFISGAGASDVYVVMARTGGQKSPARVASPPLSSKRALRGLVSARWRKRWAGMHSPPRRWCWRGYGYPRMRCWAAPTAKAPVLASR